MIRASLKVTRGASGARSTRRTNRNRGPVRRRRLRRARSQRVDQKPVLDHVRERLARIDLAREIEKDGRVMLRAAVGDHHVENRLGRINHVTLQTPSASNNLRQAAAIAEARGSRLGRCGKGRIGDDDQNLGPRPCRKATASQDSTNAPPPR